MTTKKKQTSVRLSDRGREILHALAEKSGVSITAIIEIALRHEMEREGIVIEEKARKTDAK
jgi:predicted transcriptional regulator